MPETIQEVVVMVHGVQPDVSPRINAGRYAEFFDGVSGRVDDGSPWKTARRVEVEWGKKAGRAPDPEANHRRLSKAQRNYADAILAAVGDEGEWTWNPAGRAVVSGLRSLCVRGFGDMFYYVSEDGKKSLRGSLATYLADQVSGGLAGSDGALPSKPLSLTFVGHSAGAVACADFLFFLFRKDRPAEEFLGCKKNMIDPLVRKNLDELKARAEDGSLRVRRLITLGSPFSMVLARSAEVVERLADYAKNTPPEGRPKLNPRDYGVLDSAADGDGSRFEDQLTGPRWINVWDKDDLIAYPVEPVFEAGEAVVDLNINVGSGLRTVHGKYWSDKTVYQTLAGMW
ncbi:MAG: hypothetical protein AAF750_18780 [Planctomycetota bacterium]